MEKEEIEKTKIVLEKIKRHIEYEETIEKVEDYIQYLEQKESILDKVTDKLKEDANQKIPLAEDMDWVRCRKEHAREILNIIEGGSNGK